MRSLKAVLRWTALGLLALALLSILGTWLHQQRRHADASVTALAAMRSDAAVRIDEQRFLTLRPATGDERRGVIVYPGAYVDVRGYVPTLKPIAAAGYRVVVVPMPFELAVFGIDRALDVIEANRDISSWVIIGHSVGGAMAAVVADREPQAFDGVIIWDSYPPSFASLDDYPKPAWLIHRATPDGAPPPSFARHRNLFPRDSRWAAIPGGIHMQFGSFEGGGYVEDWEPALSEAEQHRAVVRLTLEALEQMHGAPAG
jgi:pimeloyl-ACP methyl ester carboxylesterase